MLLVILLKFCLEYRYILCRLMLWKIRFHPAPSQIRQAGGLILEYTARTGQSGLTLLLSG